MKFWIFGPGVCLLITPELVAQYGSRASEPRDTFESQRLMMLAQEFSRSRVNTPARPSPPPGEEAVVSLHRLTYKIDKRARKLSEKGMREYRRQHYLEALPLLQKAVDIDPHSAVLQNNLGVAYCALGRDQEARQAFQRAVQADAGAVNSYVNLAAVAFDNYEYDLAETSARQALRIAPLSPPASVLLGLAEVAQNHWTSEARQLLTANRSRFAQAELILQHWPSAEELRAGTKMVVVHGAGPAALAKVPVESANSSRTAR
jgi:tetratricopeptide (TPR) repeat protein